MTLAARHVAAVPTPSPWLVPTLTLGTSVNILGARALPVFLPLVATDLGTSVALLGQVPAVMLLVAALLALVAGPLADQYGYRLMLVMGLSAVGVSAAATAFAPGILALLVVTAVGALGRAAVLPTAQAVVAARFEDEEVRRRSMSWVTTGLSVSAILGVPLLTTVAALSHWRASFLMLGGLALAAAAATWMLVNDTDAQRPRALRLRSVLAAYAPLRRDPRTLALIGSSLAGDIGMWATATYLSAFLMDRHGFDIQAVGWVHLGLGVLATLGLVLAGGRLGARPRPLLVACRLANGLVVCAAVALPLPGLLSAGLLVSVGAVLGTAQLLTSLLLTSQSPAGRATTLTLNSAALCLGMALGGSLGGLLLTLGGYEMVGVGSLAWLLVAAGLVAWSRPHGTTSPRAVAP